MAPTIAALLADLRASLRLPSTIADAAALHSSGSMALDVASARTSLERVAAALRSAENADRRSVELLRERSELRERLANVSAAAATLARCAKAAENQIALLEAAAAALGLTFDVDDADEEKPLATLSNDALVVDVALSASGEAVSAEVQLIIDDTEDGVVSLAPEAASVLAVLQTKGRTEGGRHTALRTVLSDVVRRANLTVKLASGDSGLRLLDEEAALACALEALVAAERWDGTAVRRSARGIEVSMVLLPEIQSAPPASAVVASTLRSATQRVVFELTSSTEFEVRFEPPMVMRRSAAENIFSPKARNSVCHGRELAAMAWLVSWQARQKANSAECALRTLTTPPRLEAIARVHGNEGDTSAMLISVDCGATVPPSNGIAAATIVSVLSLPLENVRKDNGVALQSALRSVRTEASLGSLVRSCFQRPRSEYSLQDVVVDTNDDHLGDSLFKVNLEASETEELRCVCELVGGDEAQPRRALGITFDANANIVADDDLAADILRATTSIPVTLHEWQHRRRLSAATSPSQKRARR